MGDAAVDEVNGLFFFRLGYSVDVEPNIRRLCHLKQKSPNCLSILWKPPVACGAFQKKFLSSVPPTLPAKRAKHRAPFPHISASPPSAFSSASENPRGSLGFEQQDPAAVCGADHTLCVLRCDPNRTSCSVIESQDEIISSAIDFCEAQHARMIVAVVFSLYQIRVAPCHAERSVVEGSHIGLGPRDSSTSFRMTRRASPHAISALTYPLLKFVLG